MAETITPEIREKATITKQLRANNRESLRSKKILVDGWLVYHFDDWNVVVHKSGATDSTFRYFPNIKYALHSLLSILVGEKSQSATEVRQVLVAIDQAEKAIQKTLVECSGMLNS